MSYLKHGIALSFSGSGHLLVYQLAVASRLLSPESKWAQRITCFTGASGGAIAAAACALLPASDLLQFAKEKGCAGRAFHGLKNVFDAQGDFAMKALEAELKEITRSRRLWISATKCETGGNVLFNSFNSRADLKCCLQASLAIPRSFHPFDLTTWAKPAYPKDEGVLVHQSCQGTRNENELKSEGEPQVNAYCDGGISWTAPILGGSKKRDQSTLLAVHTISISPITGPNGLLAPPQTMSDTRAEFGHWHVTPRHQGFRLPFLKPKLGAMPCYLSMANLRALGQAVAGQPQILHQWLNKGLHDGDEFLQQYPTPPES